MKIKFVAVIVIGTCTLFSYFNHGWVQSIGWYACLLFIFDYELGLWLDKRDRKLRLEAKYADLHSDLFGDANIEYQVTRDEHR